MAIETSTGETLYQTSDRRIAVKEQVINTIINQIAGYGRILETSTDPYNDPRVDFMTQFIMTFALDKEQTKKMLDERDKRVLEVITSSHDTVLNNKLIGRINLECIAECMEIFDNFMGFKKRQVILEVKDGQSVKYANELNDTYIDYMMANRGDEIDTTGIREPKEKENCKSEA